MTSRYPDKNRPYSHMFVHARCIEMIRKGVDVVVFVPSEKSDNYNYEGVSVFRMPSRNITKSLNDKDVLYLHLLNIYPFSKADGWFIYKFIMKKKLPFAMYVHGSEVQRYSSRMFDFNFRILDFVKWFKKDFLVMPKMRDFFKKSRLRRNVTFLFPSVWMKEDAEKNLGQKITSFCIIPNGIDTKMFAFQNLYENRFRVLNLRPLSSRKYAVDMAIDVMSYLPEQYTLDIYGEGPYKKRYLKKIRKKGLSDRINIFGKFVDRISLSDLFSNFGIFLAPTRMDAQGVSMCEALASGLLVVSSNNTAIPEFVEDYRDGVLGDSPEEMAKKIIEVTKNPVLFERIVKEARASMEKINISKTVDGELDVLRSLSEK